MTPATLEFMRAVKALEPCTCNEIAIYLNGRMTRHQVETILCLLDFLELARCTEYNWRLTALGHKTVESGRWEL